MSLAVQLLRFLGYLLLSLTTQDGKLEIPEVRVRRLSARKRQSKKEEKKALEEAKPADPKPIPEKTEQKVEGV